MPDVAHPSLLHDASAIALRQSKTRPSCDTSTAATRPRRQRAGEPALRRSYQRPRLGYVSAADSSPVPSLSAPPHDGTYLCAQRADDDNDDGPRATSFSDQERCAPSSKSLSDTTNASDALDIATPPQATTPQTPTTPTATAGLVILQSRHGHDTAALRAHTRGDIRATYRDKQSRTGQPASQPADQPVPAPTPLPRGGRKRRIAEKGAPGQPGL